MDLKPCPFCAGKAEKYSVRGSYGYYPEKRGVRCANKDCSVQPSVAFDVEYYDVERRGYVHRNAEDLASSAWNKRPS